jgi:hypothetical protein
VGSAEEAIDGGLANGTTYYYAIFAYDGSYNYSAGASANAIPTGTDTSPPTPNLIASIDAGSTSLDIKSVTATDGTLPVLYELDGQFYDGASWADAAGGVGDYAYSSTRPNPWTDSGLLENGLYQYRQRVKDSVGTPNESTWSAWEPKATLLDAPTDAEVVISSVTETGTTVTVATPPMPSGAGSTGAYFDIRTGEGQGAGGLDRGWADNYAVAYANLNVNTQYGWWVKYHNYDGVETGTNPTEQKRFTLANAPSAPALAAPTSTTLELSINANGNPSWTEMAIKCVAASPADSSWQDKWIDSAGSPAASAVWQMSVNWGTVTASQLSPSTTYSFQVVARNGDGIVTAFSLSGSGATAPGAVASITVPSGDFDGSYTIAWSAVPGATGYELWEAEDSSFTAPTQVYDGVDVSTPVAGRTVGSYWYRVCAKDAVGSGDWCTGGACIVPAAPSSIVVPASDPDGGFTVSWSPVAGATSYELWQATDSSFAGEAMVYDSTATSATITVPGEGAYWYRVRAKNGTGVTGWTSGGPCEFALPPSSTGDGGGCSASLNQAASSLVTGYLAIAVLFAGALLGRRRRHRVGRG